MTLMMTTAIMMMMMCVRATVRASNVLRTGLLSLSESVCYLQFSVLAKHNATRACKVGWSGAIRDAG